MRTATLSGLLLAMVIFFAATGVFAQEAIHAQHHGTNSEIHDLHGIKPPGPEAHPFEKEMYRDMVKMMVDMHAPGYTGNWDVDFLAMMIPHHQGAIDMARLALIHGKDPLTRLLAEGIIASQQAEIDSMKARLAILKEKGQDSNPGGFPSLTGTRGIANDAQ